MSELIYLTKKLFECSQELECIRKYLSDLISKHEKSTKTTEFVKIHETAKIGCHLYKLLNAVLLFLKKAIENTTDV